MTHILLFGKAFLDIQANILILNASMNNIVSTNRFEEIRSSFLTFFPYPNVFFEAICSYSSSS